MNDEDLREMISALIDGELDDAEAAAVRELIDRSPDARKEFDDLGQVRSMLRDLPAVDPPFGFYERMLRPARARRTWPRVGAAIASAAAAIVVIVGITPATDSIVPPVQAFAARHDQMVSAHGGANIPPVAPATTSPATTPPGTTPLATSAVTASAANNLQFDPLPAPMLDTMAAPYTAPPSMVGGTVVRTFGAHTSSGVVHLMYADGTLLTSIYEQPGSVVWDRLPAGGKKMTVAGDAAWTMELPSTTAVPIDEVVVLVRGPIVYTVVTSEPHDEMMAMVGELPRAPDPSVTDRASAACRAVVVRFGFGE